MEQKLSQDGMSTYVTVTTMGKDKPGVLNKLSKSIKSHGGNIDIQKGSALAGEFTILLLVSINHNNENEISKMINELNSMRDENLYVRAKRSVSESLGVPKGFRKARVLVTGADQLGILEQITLLFFENSINLESIEQGITNAPLSGDALFHMDVGLFIPDKLDMADFQKKLVDLEDALSINIDLKMVK